MFPNARRTDESYIGKGVDIVGVGKYMIQCKCKKNYSPISAIKEVPRSSGIVPVLVTKGDREEIMAVLPLSDLIEMMDKVEAIGE